MGALTQGVLVDTLNRFPIVSKLIFMVFYKNIKTLTDDTRKNEALALEAVQRLARFPYISLSPLSFPLSLYLLYMYIYLLIHNPNQTHAGQVRPQRLPNMHPRTTFRLHEPADTVGHANRSARIGPYHCRQ
jgi:hypothetical protein